MRYFEMKKRAFMSIVNNDKKLLPPNYQQVEYIESTGTQYIDTEFYPKDGKYIMTAKIKSSVVPLLGVAQYYRVFGNLSSENASDTTLYRYQYRGLNEGTGYNTDAVCCGTAVNGEAKALFTWQNYTDYEIEVDGIDKTYTINGKTAVYVGKVASYIAQTSIKLMAANSTGTRDAMKFYNFKVENQKGERVVDMYPCYRKSDNVIGMYDVARNMFITNAGTGVFLKGESI